MCLSEGIFHLLVSPAVETELGGSAALAGFVAWLCLPGPCGCSFVFEHLGFDRVRKQGSKPSMLYKSIYGKKKAIGLESFFSLSCLFLSCYCLPVLCFVARIRFLLSPK